MFLVYFLLWGGFLIGSLLLGAALVLAGVRLLIGWRPHPSRERAVRAVVGLGSASLFGLAYGALMWFGFPPDDPSRGITAIPPLVFGVLAMAAAASVALASWIDRRTGANEPPDHLRAVSAARSISCADLLPRSSPSSAAGGSLTRARVRPVTMLARRTPPGP